MWWMRGRADIDVLPKGRVVAQFDFHGAASVSFWLILTKDDVRSASPIQDTKSTYSSPPI